MYEIYEPSSLASRPINHNVSTKIEEKVEISRPVELEEEDDLSKPVEFSKTAAAKWKAKHTREPEEVAPPYQGLVVSLSLGTFMLYFFVLREENDVDAILYRPLSETLKEINDKKAKMK